MPPASGGDGEADVLVRLRVGERHPDRRLRVKLQRAQALAADVAHVQRQAADNLLHQAASLEDEHLVVHVAGAAKKAQVAEHRRLPYAPAALVLVADEHRRLAAVRPGRGGQVEGRKNQARKHRAREPLPVGADEHQHVRKVDLFVLLQGGALGLLFFVCHAFSFISSKLVTFFLAAQRPGEGKPPAGASVPGGTVNYCTSHGELLYFTWRTTVLRHPTGDKSRASAATRQRTIVTMSDAMEASTETADSHTLAELLELMRLEPVRMSFGATYTTSFC